MNLNEAFLTELKHESASTRRMLERAPADKYDWKPHEKSATLGRLTSHIAEITSWLNAICEQPELDFATYGYTPRVFTSTADLLQFFDETLAGGTAALQTTTNESIMEKWKLRRGEQIFMDVPRVAAIRTFVLNHIVHHRGQLSVYLRLLGVPVPSVYGPTADEPM